jgi:hypothetical protein
VALKESIIGSSAEYIKREGLKPLPLDIGNG